MQIKDLPEKLRVPGVEIYVPGKPIRIILSDTAAEAILRASMQSENKPA